MFMRLEEEILSLSAFELQRFRRFEVHTFVRARIELRQSAWTKAFDLGGVMRAVTRAFVQRARTCASVRYQVSPAGIVLMQTDHLMANGTFGIERIKSPPSEEFYGLDNPYVQDPHGCLAAIVVLEEVSAIANGQEPPPIDW
jgi:hypothetical protein